MLTVVVPWPPKALWPNRRPFWAAKARALAIAKEQANDAAIVAAWDQGQSAETIDLTRAEIPVTYTFYPPANRRYDLDGALSACKGYQDGLALAMGIDDVKFVPTPRRGERVPGGQVVIEIR